MSPLVLLGTHFNEMRCDLRLPGRAMIGVAHQLQQFGNANRPVSTATLFLHSLFTLAEFFQTIQDNAR
jgi:hypothetical protein